MKRFGIFVLVFLVLAVFTWAAGEKDSADTPKELQKMNFQLNWKVMGDHAPYFVALKKGWFEEEGLDVNIIIGQGSAYTVQALDTGKAEMGISDAPVPIKLRAEGAKVKIVGIIFDKHPNSMYFWKDSGITKPSDIAGRTVAVPASDGHKVMWPAFARLIGVDPDDVKFVNIDPAAKVAALASRNADVVFELYTGKPFMEKAIPAEELGVFIWSDYGFNAYAHSYIARDDVIENNPEMVRKFLKAAYRAWEFTLENPEEAIDILSEYHPINKDDYVTNLEVMMDFFKTDRYNDNGIGYIDPSRIQDTIDTVSKYMNVDINYSLEDIYSSDFLPSPMYKYDY